MTIVLCYFLFVWICSLGVMAARGLLANPAMFDGYEDTPLECVWDWVDIAVEQGTPFTCFHQHLIYMLERVSSQPERKVFNSLSSTSAVIDYLQNTYGSVSELGTWQYWNVIYLIFGFFSCYIFMPNKTVKKLIICLMFVFISYDGIYLNVGN